VIIIFQLLILSDVLIYSVSYIILTQKAYECGDMMRDEREVTILVGMQGSGKTWYCKKALPDYIPISQDEGPRTYQGVVR
jgi:hypothetical protein